MNKYILGLLIALCPILVKAQKKQGGVWYFGYNAGINFNTDPPTALSGGQIFSTDGSSVVCDAYGQLLFYSDGVSVWNKQHRTMPNGTGLSGQSSATNSAFIVRHEQLPNRYYLLTTDAFEKPQNNGLRYSVIDITHDGGLGDVVAGSKNIQLHATCSEKLTACMHSNGVDVWVIAEIGGLPNQWHAYLLTKNGLTPTPVVSMAGNALMAGTGQLKASFDSQTLISAEYHVVNFLKFDNSTAKISLLSCSPSNSSLYTGVEFSANSKFAYALTIGYGSTSEISQIPLINGIPDYTSVRHVSTSTNGISSALQMAPNGKIYVANAGSNYLSVIEKPDQEAPLCQFKADVIDLSPGLCILGLPTLFQASRFSSRITQENPCNLVQHFTLPGIHDVHSFVWHFGDGSTATDQKPTHAYTTAGTYQVRIALQLKDNSLDTITREVRVYEHPLKPIITHE